MTQNSSHGMTCPDFQTLMEEYIADELDTATESAIASHLATCDSCQHELRLAKTIDSVLDDLPKPTSPPDILREVTAYVRANPHNSGWMRRFLHTFTDWDIIRSPLLRASVLVCLVGIALFGIHQHQKDVELAQAKSDFDYAISKMQYAFHRTGIAVNDSFTSLNLDEAPRRALKPTANISSAINRSLGILNRLTGVAPNSDTITPEHKRSDGNPTETTTPNQGGNTQ